jgi:DNA-directed RNA polymerase specialized sigma24 family protein
MRGRAVVGAKHEQLAPSDYHELFEQYYGLIHQLVRQGGIDEQDAADVANEILLRFMERDYLGVFEPGLMFDTPAGPRESRFRGFLVSIVKKYLRGYVGRQRRRRHHEPVRCEAPVTHHGESPMEPQLWIEVFGIQDERAYEVVEDRIDYGLLVAHAQLVLEAHQGASRVSLAWVFTRAIEQIESEGSINRRELADELGVTTTSVGTAIMKIRGVFAEYGVVPRSVSTV